MHAIICEVLRHPCSDSSCPPYLCFPVAVTRAAALGAASTFFTIFTPLSSFARFSQCQDLLGDVQMGGAGDFYDDFGVPDSDEEDALMHLPPGEEGMLQSHAGQDTTFDKIMAGVRPGYRGDLCIRDDHVQKVVDSWKRQLPALINVYLDLKAHGARETNTDTPNAWSVPALGFDEDGYRSFVFTQPSDTANVTLVHHGYIGSAPEQPGLVFPLRLFEIFRQLHRVCPRFSLHALGKMLMNLHQGPRRPSLQNQMTIMYDAYLEVLRGVDARMRHALGRPATWYMDNVCPPCLYKIVNEPKLKFSWLGAMDGNNSLKLVWDAFRAGNPRADDQISSHDRWITVDQVDVFKDKVSESQKRPRGTGPVLSQMHSSATASIAKPSGSPAAPCGTVTAPESPSARETQEAPPEDLDDNIAWLNVNKVDAMEVEELAKCINTCVDRWRNAGPEQHKKMFALFAVLGIFLTVCRQGHVIVMCDMICSGELMKYPLAMVKWLLDRYGKDIGLGYDIMCAFFKTLLRSSLGPRVVAMNLRGVVPAFHGHAHNRAC
ncbi:hypothetical protein DFH07DRAFT_955712 [Mycena maculata]|uniref:CxC1-like cysteine cluster associated with KDZ transposases domain-containing protein n=1 Tax=Mycena maculata TaxID=230809 RepID=A0AAD7JKY3_9AGAR|nr:hypothetical protein DFH07DRAFT_955712 [Mycena maculata]